MVEIDAKALDALRRQIFRAENSLEHLEGRVRTLFDGSAWFEHDGSGDPPRYFPFFVQVRFADGEEMVGSRWDWDQNWTWKPGSAVGGHIVAYRPMAAEAHLAKHVVETAAREAEIRENNAKRAARRAALDNQET